MKIQRKNYLVKMGKNYYSFSIFVSKGIYKKQEKVLIKKRNFKS